MSAHSMAPQVMEVLPKSLCDCELASNSTNTITSMPSSSSTVCSASSRIGLDIGGTLCKLVHFEPFSSEDGYSTSDVSVFETAEVRSSSAADLFEEDLTIKCQSRDKKETSRRRARKIWESSHDPIVFPSRGIFHFKRFETSEVEEFLALSKEHSLVKEQRFIGATGGGARKFGDKFLQLAGIQLCRADELTSLVKGIDFLARCAPQDCFIHPTARYLRGIIQRPWSSPENSGDEDDTKPGYTLEQSSERKRKADVGEKDAIEQRERANLRDGDCLYPYLVVNVGSGVSILRVDSADDFERVGGTSVGGSTFLGLASVLTGCTSFKEAIELASNGDSTKVDMLVGDIYGGDYSEMGLAATTVASSFGKLAQPAKNEAASKTPEDLAKAALLMVTNNVCSIAMLHARPAGVKNIMFTGSFMHNNKLAMRLLTVAIDFWSKGNMRAMFLRHEGHAGAIGALLSTLDPSDPIDALLLL